MTINESEPMGEQPGLDPDKANEHIAPVIELGAADPQLARLIADVTIAEVALHEAIEGKAIPYDENGQISQDPSKWSELDHETLMEVTDLEFALKQALEARQAYLDELTETTIHEEAKDVA